MRDTRTTHTAFLSPDSTVRRTLDSALHVGVSLGRSGWTDVAVWTEREADTLPFWRSLVEKAQSIVDELEAEADQ